MIAIATFAASASHFFSAWIQHGRLPSAAFLLEHPLVGLSAAAAVACVLYFLALFGSGASGGGAGASLMPPAGQPAKAQPAKAQPEGAAAGAVGGAAVSACRSTAALSPDYDADVVIVGAGTAGAALATVLARDGKRVVLIERYADPRACASQLPPAVSNNTRAPCKLTSLLNTCTH